MAGTLVIWLVSSVAAQNLVPNPGFETYTICPSFLSELELATPWVSATEATPDYFNACASNLLIDVPTNFGGYQQPLNGNGYAGCYFKGPPNYREYAQVALSEPLDAGKCYHIGFFINLMNLCCGVDKVGLYVSAVAPTSVGTMVLPFEPQITGDGGYYSDTVAWVEISGFYPAMGGEQYITIGNFEGDSETSYDPLCTLSNPFSYYYIDSIYVIEEGPTSELSLELGPPVEACLEYEIDGESGDFLYTWSDGSHEHTLTVNTSGVYGLTITEGCAIGIDSVEVTFEDIPPVAINPGFISLCEGQSYTVTLDPGAGDYLWSDGSTASNYTITEPGLYSVTLDDGCDLSSDGIMVEVTLLPIPVYLGNDTTLCEGDGFEITVDPGTNDIQWQDGSHFLTYTIEMPGIYAVTVSNTCGEVSDEIEVTGLQSPLIDLGPDTVGWCEGDVITYDFDPALGDFSWSDNSFDPVFSIYDSGIYSVTVTNQCGNTQDMVTVYEAPEPMTGLDDTIDVCSSSFPYTLSLAQSSPVDEILWSTGDITPQITVSGPGDYAVTISNTCYTISDHVHVQIITTPDVTLPDTSVICLSDTLLLNADVPLATYLWQNGSTLSTFEVTAPGWYAVTVSTACGTDSDSTLVTSFPIMASPDLGPDLTLCPGGQITLYANSGSGMYLWNDMSIGDSLSVTTPGTYSVTVMDQCTTSADTILITASNAPPDVDLPSALTLCQGQTIVVDALLAGVSYIWSDGTTDPSLPISLPGTYSLTVTNRCGADQDSVMVLDGGALPVIDLGLDIQLCPGDVQVLTPDLSTADAWLWQDGSTNPTFLVNSATTITIEVSNACGSSFDTLYAALLPDVPSFNLGNDTSLCPSDILVLAINTPGVNITWFDGSHDDQITVTGSGTFTAEIENSCGVSADTLIVAPLPQIPSLSLGPDQFLCPGELLTFSPGIQDVQYLWQDGSTASSYSTTQPQLVVLSISNECGVSMDSVMITESTDGPQLDLGPDVTGCDGSIVTIQSGITGVTYTWQDGSSGPFYQLIDDAVLTLHIANSCGVDDDTIAVYFIPPPDPDLGPDTVLCDQAVLTLTSIAGPETTLTWQDGSHAPDYVVTTAGTYSIWQSNACGDKADSIAVSYLSVPPAFSLGPDVVLCPGESITLQSPPTTDQVLWQDGSDSLTFTADQDQLYSLTIFNVCGSTHDDVNVDFDHAIPVIPTEGKVICPGEVLILDASQPFDALYTWSTGATVPSIDVVLPGDYVVTVMTPCFTVSGTTSVVTDDDCSPTLEFYIPNVFSPNDDQINDVFSIQFNAGTEVIALSGDIFDRWGNHVFRSRELPFAWDGSLQGEPLNPGVFVYVFTFTYSNGASMVTKTVMGDITLMR